MSPQILNVGETGERRIVHVKLLIFCGVFSFTNYDYFVFGVSPFFQTYTNLRAIEHIWRHDTQTHTNNKATLPMQKFECNAICQYRYSAITWYEKCGITLAISRRCIWRKYVIYAQIKFSLNQLFDFFYEKNWLLNIMNAKLQIKKKTKSLHSLVVNLAILFSDYSLLWSKLKIPRLISQ